MSEFGKGLTYCIGLFLAHESKDKASIIKIFDGDFHIWFNGAADHLFEMQIPEKFPENLKTKLESFQNQCLHWRCSPASEENFKWAIREAKDLLIEIDKQIGIAAIEGEWE